MIGSFCVVDESNDTPKVPFCGKQAPSRRKKNLGYKESWQSCCDSLLMLIKKKKKKPGHVLSIAPLNLHQSCQQYNCIVGHVGTRLWQWRRLHGLKKSICNLARRGGFWGLYNKLLTQDGARESSTAEAYFHSEFQIISGGWYSNKTVEMAHHCPAPAHWHATSWENVSGSSQMDSLSSDEECTVRQPWGWWGRERR